MLFEVARSEGPHVVVTVRAGPKDTDRALLGRLTMDEADWQALRSLLVPRVVDLAGRTATLEIRDANLGPEWDADEHEAYYDAFPVDDE